MDNPMYRQIAEDLRRRIESGGLAPGGQLPTELELREEYNASRNTVRDAIKSLINLGLVATRPGQGTFVVKKIDPLITTLSGDAKTGFGGGEGTRYRSEMEGRDKKPTTSPIQIEIQEASPDIAQMLGQPDGIEVVSRHEKRSIDGTPWSMLTSFYPLDSWTAEPPGLPGRATSKKEPSSTWPRHCASIRRGYRDWIAVRAPDAEETEFFRLAPDGRTSIIQISRTAYDGNGQPMRVTVTVYPADRNQFIVDFGQVPEQALR